MQANRIERLRKICNKHNLDAFLISTNSNIFYLSNFSAFLTNDHDGFCLVTKNAIHLLTTPLYSEAVKHYVPNVVLHETTHGKWYTELLHDIIKNEKIRKIGFEPQDIRYSEYHEFSQAKIHLIPTSLRELRAIKAEDEIKNLQKACEISDQTFSYVIKNIKEGLTEKQIAWEMEKYIKEKGAQLAFDTIVAFGENTALIHHMTTDKKLEKNEFVLLDFGAKVNLYCSDMSRTVFNGTPSSQQKKLHNTVLTAQQKAIDYFAKKDKMKASSVDKLARKVVTDAGFPEYPHSLGHGIGLDYHEAPIISEYSRDTLEDGMVFTIEPGIYLPGVGGVRIEDVFLLKKTGLKQLTTSPKELIVLS